MPPVLHSALRKYRGNQRYSVKVVQARLEKEAGRVEFQMEGQTFVDVTEATANVENILNAVQDNWGDNYVLVMNDGL